VPVPGAAQIRALEERRTRFVLMGERLWSEKRRMDVRKGRGGGGRAGGGGGREKPF